MKSNNEMINEVMSVLLKYHASSDDISMIASDLAEHLFSLSAEIEVLKGKIELA